MATVPTDGEGECPAKPLPQHPPPAPDSGPSTRDAPLPPRKNRFGLPPTYLSHLRALLRQWLEQQYVEDDGLPNPTAGGKGYEPRHVWDQERLAHIEEVLWKGIILPQAQTQEQEKDGQHEDGRKGLLELDWNGWIEGAMRRRKAWREDAIKRKEAEEGPGITGNPTASTKLKEKEKDKEKSTNAAKRVSTSDPDGRGRIAATPQAGLMTSSVSTPIRGPTRPPSVASTTRSGKPEDSTERLAGQRESRPVGTVDEDEVKIRDWCDLVSGLKGFESLVPVRTTLLPKKDEWEVIGDDVPAPPARREVPGAFPQTSAYDPPPSPPPKPAPRVVAIASTPREPLARYLKPVFCFSAQSTASTSTQHPTTSTSTSTLRLKRHPSTGAESNSSLGPSSKGWWGSGNKWSEMTVTQQQDQELEVSFIEGKFALPSCWRKQDDSENPGLHSASATPSRKKTRSFSASSSGTTATDSDERSFDDVHSQFAAPLEDDGASTWSGTQRGTLRISPPRERIVNAVIGGGEDDVPRYLLDEVGLVGGTVTVRGIVRDEERSALEQVLRVLLYTVQGMFLELELLDAFQIPREADPPLPLPPKPKVPARHNTTYTAQTRSQSSDLQRKLSLKERGEKKGFFQRLGQESKGVWDGLLGRGRRTSGLQDDDNETTNGGRHDERFRSSIDDSTTRSDQVASSSHEPLARSLVTAPPREAGLPGSSGAPDFMGTPQISASTDRYLQTLSRLENLVQSPTPGLAAPLPPLLLRLREEQRTRTEKARQELLEENPATQPSAGFPISAGIQTPFSALGTPMRHTSNNHTQDALRGRALGYRLGGDVRVGLTALIPGIDTFSGWQRLQRLETLYFVSVDEQETPPSSAEPVTATVNEQSPEHEKTVVCQKPKPATMIFYDSQTDVSIADFLEDLGQEMQEDMAACSRSGCVATSWDHRKCFFHGGKMIVLRTEEVKGADDESEDGKIEVWTKCSTCSASTQCRTISHAASAYSWGKFLEVLLYSKILQLPTFCPHTRATESSTTIEYYFRTSKLTLAISIQVATVLDARLPKLQVGPNVPKRKAGKLSAETILDGIVRREEKEASRAILRGEIRSFFASIEQRIDLLRLRLVPPPIEKDVIVDPGSQVDTAKAEVEAVSAAVLPTDESVLNHHLETLSTISADLLQVESALYETLETTPSAQLNDARRELDNQIKLAIAKVATWQKEHKVDEDFADAPLVLPAYVDGKTHALPGSSILIREEEPSSIIAYTLSSLAYFNELTANHKAGQEDAPEKASEPPASASDNRDDDWSIEVKRRSTPRDLLSLRTINKKRSEVSMLPARGPAFAALTPNVASLELSLEQVEGKSQSGDMLSDLVKTISKATAQDPILTGKARVTSSSSDIENIQQFPTVTIRDGQQTPVYKGLGDKPRSPTKAPRRPTNDLDLAPPSAFRATRSVSSTVTVASTPSASSAAATPNAKEGWSSVTSSFANSFNHILRLGSDVSESIGSIRVRGTDRSLSSLIGPLTMMSTMDNSLSTSSLDNQPHIQFTYTLGSGDRLKFSCTVYYATAFDSLRRRCAIDKSILASLSRTNSWDVSGGKSKAAFFMTDDKRFVVKELVSKWNVSDTHALLEIAPAYFEYLASTHNKATSLAKIVGFYSVKIQDSQSSVVRKLDLLVMENIFYKQDISKTFDLKGIEGRKVPKATPAAAAPAPAPPPTPAPSLPPQAPALAPSPSDPTPPELMNKPLPSSPSPAVLFDADWLEGMTRSPILLHPHAKRILSEALSTDTRFLSTQSVMDYSLLLGLDNAKGELVVGLVDAIGSYNLFKTIESRGKLALNRGGEVTVIPPDQYRERFDTALKQYFLACPDKWSRTSRRVTMTDIPSVL